MIRTPEFWRESRISWPAMLLAPIGFLYGRITLRRMRKTGWRAPVPVISVGNFTAGGAGKTPTALAIAAALAARGERPVFISRGHGGAKAGPHLVDPARDTARQVGDEPLLLARLAPAIIARDRAKAARLALGEGATCLILDDALQNPALEKDLSIAVIDGGAGFGNGLCVPAGPLRAPVAGQLRHVDLALLIGEDRRGIASALAGRVPLHRGTIEPTPEARDLAGRRVFAFSGIALPEKFAATLRALGAEIAGQRHFPDHHPFSEADAGSLLDEAARLDAVPVTTEKDRVRLDAGPASARLATASRIVPVRLKAEPGFFDAIYRALVAARSRLSTASGPE